MIGKLKIRIVGYSQWINPKAKKILIKVTLSNLPIYLCTTLFYPVRTLNEMGGIIKDFI
jgi:hypothetical protein